MIEDHDTMLLASTTGSIQRGFVVEILPGGEVSVEIPGEPALRVLCDVLRTSSRHSLELRAGTQVLVLPPTSEDVLGCVLGAVGPYQPPVTESETDDRHVVVEGKEDLVLRCGESSITLGSEGRILIKGKDLVSHAKRTNRIKGGSVAIN